MQRFLTILCLSSLSLVCLSGCAKSGNQKAPATAATPVSAAHTHEGWWCEEHGLPEEKCAMCNPKLAAELKAKGDWCAKHDRPDSICFICHPEKQQVFIDTYKAKYDMEPPPRKE